jgi:DNA repair photolyase
MKTINGKAIYSPNGKAGEYAKYACNFYVGCSNGCHYCYLRKGVLAHAMGGDKPTLKKCFNNEVHALKVFDKELKANLPELQKHGLFFSFTTDPMLPKTSTLTEWAIDFATWYGVKCTILTKCSRPFLCGDFIEIQSVRKNYLAVGFTLTGHDDLEPNASPNAERIEAMRELHDAGFKTWASIEPVIDFDSSWRMVRDTFDFCDLYKIGIERGKTFPQGALRDFMDAVMAFSKQPIIYFKDSLLKAAGIRREDLPANCVTRDYDIFKKNYYEE